MNKPWLLLALALYAAAAQAQNLSGISSRWSDSFVEWELFVFAADTSTQAEEPDDAEAPDEELYGELKLRWLNLRDDWTEWDYTLGDESGTIKLKWKDDLTHWELRTFAGDVVTMRAAWSNDLTEWRVTDNAIPLNLRSRWSGQLDEWLVDDATYGKFYIYTLMEGDPRDWAIDDGLEASVSQPMKMALIFLAIFHSSPRI